MRTNIVSGLILVVLLATAGVFPNCSPALAQAPEVIVASEFNSTGDLIQGWYWLRDEAHQQTADWIFNALPAGTGDIELRFEVLATNQVSGPGGIDAEFFLSYGIPPSGQMGGLMFGRVPVTLRNQPVTGDTTGYYCLGTVILPRAALQNAQVLWLHVNRADELNQFPPSPVHVAFRLESIVLSAVGPGGEPALSGASDFQTNGDEIQGWYWLRDEARQQFARWQFSTASVPVGSQTVSFDVNALATNTYNGGPGFPADFRVALVDQNGTTVDSQIVQLPNTAPPGDPLGYACHGLVSLNWPALTGDHFFILVTRDPQMNNHVAFNRDSMMLLGTGTGGTTTTTTTTLADADSQDQAITIQPGTYSGELGQTLSDGNRDNEDWYAITVQAGQIITIRLTMPSDANFTVSLHEPGQSSGSGLAVTEGQISVLQYVASVSGSWSIRIRRSSGEGQYQLAVTVENQNDANSGGDAGDDRLTGLVIAPGSYEGFLHDDDDHDWYAFNAAIGQIIIAQLAVPRDADLRLSLRNPSGSSQGSVQTPGGTQTVSYAADATGLWYLRIERQRGQGTYSFSLSVQDQNDAASGCDAGSCQDSALIISPGTYTGHLQDNDDLDWYAFSVVAGQTIKIELSASAGMNVSLALKNPSGETQGNVQRSGSTSSVAFIADATGLWYVRIARDRGEGDYQFALGLSG